MLHVFLALCIPVPSTALVRSRSSLRAREVNLTGSGVGKEDNQWWPFNVFGGSGSGSGNGPFTQKLENVGDAQYFGTIEVGGQKVKAVIDTGSFELLVFGSNCTDCGGAKDLYDSSKSKSSSLVDFEAVHTFGSGTLYSKKAVDKVKINGQSVPNQDFWEVYKAEMFILADGKFQAILGVGPPASVVASAEKDDKEAHEYVNTLEKDGEHVTKEIKDTVQHFDDMLVYEKNVTSVAENLNVSNMSICLGQETDSPGYFFWDDDAPRKYPELFTTVEVHGDFYWSSPLEQVHLAGGSVKGNASKRLERLASGKINLGCSKGNCSGVVDTGTSLLVAPPSVVDAICDLADAWEEAGGSCDDLSELPELRFKLGGVDMSLPPEAYMGEVSGFPNEDLAKYMPRFLEKHNIALKKTEALAKKENMTNQDPDSYLDEHDTDLWNMCVPLVMSMEGKTDQGDLWIFGMPFFRKYYTSFQFVQEEGQVPKAATMSFSEQDGKCRPGVAPQPIDDKQIKKTPKKESIDAAASDPMLQETTKRRAQLKIDASKIIIPETKRQVTELMHPSVTIR